MALEILYRNMYDWISNLFRTLRERMKSKDIQTAVKYKHENGNEPTKIYRDLGGVVSLRTIKLWVQILNKIGSIDLSHPPCRPTKASISKVKYRLAYKKTVSTRWLVAEMSISRTSVHRMLRKDLGCFPYKKIKQLKLTDLQKRKRVKFANWLLNYYTQKWLFSNEKYFDLNGVYNVQNDCVWAISRAEADGQGGHALGNQVSIKGDGMCAEDLTVPVIIEDGTIDAERYIKEVLPIALKSGNRMLGDSWAYQQDGATSHIHHLAQK